MRFQDRPGFSKKMMEVATVVGRPVDDVEINAYFNKLAEFPLDFVCRILDRVLDDRDHEDIFKDALLPTDGELRKAISAILTEEGGPGATVGCEKCKGTGFILGERNDGSALAGRCECLLAAIEVEKKYGLKGKEK